MTEPVMFNKDLRLAAIAAVQRVLPAILVVLVLYWLTSYYGQVFDHYYRALAVAAGGLSLLLLRVKRNGRPLMLTPLPTIVMKLAGRWAGILAVLLVAGLLSGFSDFYPPELLCAWALLSPLLFIPATLALHVVKRRRVSAEENARSAVCLGFTAHSNHLAEQLTTHPALGTRFLGFFDDRSPDRLEFNGNITLLGGLKDLARYVREHKVDVIFIALPIRHLDRVMKLIDDLHDTTASIYYLPDVFVFDLIQSRPGEIMGTPVISLCETPFHGSRGVLKRVTDIVLTLLAMIPALPVMAVLALLVRFTSKGPVIFKQRRYGLDGHEIVVWKFRSMRVLEDGEEVVQVSREDPRVTPIGRILRSYSLDELPQLFNVLQGRMSLVGPRPHAVSHNEQYRKLIKGYMLRHKVLPGITGLAQVSGCRGEVEKLEDMERRVSYDLEYLRRWSPLLDLKILFLTVARVFKDSKAY
ncbi:undecaprenyl-phosphate glucose phosphotransferase [Thioalkalivibrio sp. XN279]|uniref:undecaprenyl-phosphate glucose phosphotransferase n=1 Tax=Thioalkalivibrio sp. XN279 TaxID=2714953 RepID=UPI00140E55DD|nr:undecaprenyl-phosphate glucose phosphotransferase [Thioalkalivibrio sp. XN279]NHA15385.1 undecaprenyl-phosphate glucose phosphotransferase [Thioalkalivibrio sp. XN279]